MSFRITPHRQYELGLIRTRAQTSRVATLTDQISSGVRIHRPSDDPHAQRLILNHESIISHFQSQSQAIDEVRNVLSEAHIQVRSAQQLVVNARDVGLQARQINEVADANVFALEIDGFLETLNVVANSRHDGRYLFSGSEIQTPPYADVVQQTSYQGAADSGSIQLGGAGHVRAYYSGQYVFSTGLDGTTFVRGTTGATGGAGTASGHGTGDLEVQHTLTTYSGTSGILAGAGSVAGDTVIGPAGTHQLHIVDTSGTGSSGTISLSGGPSVAFTNTDGNLEVSGPNGEIVYVDATAVTAGFSGDIDIAADGTLSMDGGQTVLPIDFSENQTLVDQQGNVRHVNSQGITQTGVDTVQLAGNSDLFETLRAFRDDLLHYEEFSATEWDTAVGHHLDAIDLAHNHLLDVVGEQSVDLQTLDRLQDRGEDLQLEAQKVLGQLQGTDFAEAVIRLQEEQNLTQYTVATLSGVFQVSVLDFLR